MNSIVPNYILPGLLAALLALLLPTTTRALPRFALLTGTRCSACHYNPTGGGMRTELGWSAMNRVGAIDPDSIGLGALFAGESNSMADGLFTLGFDTRLQSAKIGRPPNEHRMIIPMQLAPYVAVAPLDWLTAYGSYNVGKARYAGQTEFDAALLLQPGYTLPSLKMGYIQPSVGIRNDDHTMFIRREIAMNATPLLPPNYNEVGAELNYEGVRWLTLNAGIFSAHNLSQADPTVDESKPSYLARVQLWPQWLDEGINGQIGASYFGNGEFMMVNGFGGFGLADKATFYVEGMYSRNASERQIRNWTIQGSYQLREWLALEWRYEWGQTEDPVFGLFHANALVGGLQIFPLPSLELRPEYRYMDNEEYRMGQWTVQLHLFY
jgi:hypothetical protein